MSTRAVLEKKLAVAERAVENNPGCVALQLARLAVCRDLWEPAALLKEWKKLVFLHPNSAPLWRRYLLFCQGHFASFSVGKAGAAYGKCLSTLAACADGSMLSHPALPGAEEDLLGTSLPPSSPPLLPTPLWASSPLCLYLHHSRPLAL